MDGPRALNQRPALPPGSSKSISQSRRRRSVAVLVACLGFVAVLSYLSGPRYVQLGKPSSSGSSSSSSGRSDGGKRCNDEAKDGTTKMIEQRLNDTIQRQTEQNELLSHSLRSAVDLLMDEKTYGAIAETSARMTLRAAIGMETDGCPDCPPCRQKVSFPAVCKTFDDTPCSCPYVAPEDDESGKRREGACRDGTAPGQWIDYAKWEADTCHYREFSPQELQKCLGGRWIHFFGDETSRVLATSFARALGVKKRTLYEKSETARTRGRRLSAAAETEPGYSIAKGRTFALEGSIWRKGTSPLDEEGTGGRQLLADERDRFNLDKDEEQNDAFQIVPRGRQLLADGAGDEAPSVTYLFRAKFAHQRAPGPGDTEEDDLHNVFFQEMQKPGALRPDVVVMNVGIHEVVGWSGRPRVRLDLDEFKSDLEELLVLLNGTLPKKRVVWWKAHYIQPGKVQGVKLFNVRRFHKGYQEHAFERFKEEGHSVLDFYQTTKQRGELAKGDGVHYMSEVVNQHVKILLNTLCNSVLN